MEKTAIIVDAAIHRDKRIIDKEKEKSEKYQNLKREIQRLCDIKKIDVIPAILGVLGIIRKNFEKYVDPIGCKIDLHTLQKTTLLGAARILRKVLECLCCEKQIMMMMIIIMIIIIIIIITIK